MGKHESVKLGSAIRVKISGFRLRVWSLGSRVKG